MGHDRREPLRVVFSASLRADSPNSRLANLGAGAIERLGASADLASMREFDTPSYDGDLERATPPGYSDTLVPPAGARWDDGPAEFILPCCMASHARSATRRGATAEEVAEALGVATLMNGGAGTVHLPRAFEAFQECTT